MAPKRKVVQSDRVSRSSMTRRYSKRLNGFNTNEAAKAGSNKTYKNNQNKKKIQNKKSASKEKTQPNNKGLLVNDSLEENSKSMSIDSVDNSDSIEAASMSLDKSSSSSSDAELIPSTRHLIDTSDDENDEFRSMFMSSTTKTKNNLNYNSTPTVSSKKNNQVARTTMDCRSPNIRNDAVLGPLSNSNIQHQSTVLNLPNRIQTPSSIRSLPVAATQSNNTAILETFPEYRSLKRDYERALKQNDTWATDFKALSHRLKKLEQSSFPRPSADGRAFIEQLLHSLNTSERDVDSRTNADLAAAIGLSEATLMSSSNNDPQKTSLRLFNILFPTHTDKESLVNVAHLTSEHPQLLDNILVFARRCSPGSGYTITMLKEAIGNSIRCARYKVKMSNTQMIAAAAINQTHQHNDTDSVGNISQTDYGFD